MIGVKRISSVIRLAGLLGLLAIAGVVAAAPAMADPLPDGRVYELVSPPDKNGGDVLVNSLRTWAASDGNAVAFASLTGFGDAAGTGIATDYLATRAPGDVPAGSQGWTTRALTPPQGAVPTLLVTTGYEPMSEGFTANLDAGVLNAFDPLTPDPDVAGVVNLYVRRGLRTAPSPSVEVATACPVCAQTGTPLAPYTATPFNMLPKLAGLSADGTHVLFESTLKLTSDATDGTTSGLVNLYEYADSAVQNVGILPNGSPAAGAVAGQGVDAGQTLGVYMPRAFSSDGSRVAFMASPTICAPEGSNYPCGNLYLRDTSSSPETTVQVNASERTPPATSSPTAIFWAMSADGQRVFFTTTDGLTNDDTNGAPDLYMFDASAPAGRQLTRISVDPSSPGGGGGADVVLGISDDGRTVYFTSRLPLRSGDPSFAGGSGIYMWRDSGSGPPQLRFVGPLTFLGDRIENRIAGSIWTEGEMVQSRVTPDGRYLLFSATNGAGLLSQAPGRSDYNQGNCNDTGAPGCRELYLYDRDAATPQQQLQCVSCRPGGATATADAADTALAFHGGSQSAGILNHPVSTDGRVFFTTAEALVPGDTNKAPDVYEWENGHVYLLSDGTDPGGSYFLDASPDGRDVFIDTHAQLSPWDTDGSFDLYDVREPGPGHPAGVPPPPSSPPACSGDGCRGSVSPVPSAPSPTTGAFVGPGNPAPSRARPGPPRCKAGTVRKRTRHGATCVKRRKPPKRRVHHKARGKRR